MPGSWIGGIRRRNRRENGQSRGQEEDILENPQESHGNEPEKESDNCFHEF